MSSYLMSGEVPKAEWKSQRSESQSQNAVHHSQALEHNQHSIENLTVHSRQRRIIIIMKVSNFDRHYISQTFQNCALLLSCAVGISGCSKIDIALWMISWWQSNLDRFTFTMSTAPFLNQIYELQPVCEPVQRKFYWLQFAEDPKRMEVEFFVNMIRKVWIIKENL